MDKYFSTPIVMEYPRLIEFGTLNYLQDALKSCHRNRLHIYHVVLNVGVFIMFCLIAGSILYYCYKKKPSAYELKRRMLKDQEYILSKIRFYQSERSNLSSTFLEKLNGNQKSSDLRS
jgi:hypothetical protein